MNQFLIQTICVRLRDSAPGLEMDKPGNACIELLGYIRDDCLREFGSGSYFFNS